MLENLKRDVCEIAKKAQIDGLCQHKSGNFSARDETTGLIVMTPTGVDRMVLTPRDMIVMDMDALVVENLSGLMPSSESLVHIKIYETRPETKAIAHTHSMYATTFAVLAKEIPAIVYEVAVMGLSKAKVPVAPYGRPGTTQLANSVVEACKEAQCFLLERHGAMTFDERNIAEAYLKAAYLEELSHLYYNALTITGGKDPNTFEVEELTGWEYPKEIKIKG